MKKKIILTLAVISMLICLFAISVSASTIYQTSDGKVLFSYTDENNDYIFDSYEGSFAKTDDNGNELTWYIVSTETENGNTIKTVASLKTVGEAGSINESGAFSFISPVTNRNTVSVNYPDNAGIKNIPMFGSYDTRSQNNILFAYLPNTLTEFPESLFQETPILIAEVDDETPVTFVPHKFCHEARNIKTINIPASVELIKSKDHREGAPFCYTYSLETVTFAPNSRLTRIQAYAFCYSNIEYIQFPDFFVAVNQNLFRGCDNLKVIRFGANFQYFENVDNNGNTTTNHQSTTHTANAIREIYLPSSFYLTKPNINYRVSYAFDGCSNAKFFFVGTKAQLDTAIANFINSEWTTGATDHNYIVTAYNEKKIVSFSEYSENPDNYKGRYIIYDYNKCDAFYGSEHLEDNNSCLINCTRCGINGEVEKNPIHNLATTISYENYGIEGTKTTACTNEGCKHILTEKTPALIVCLGYSAPEYDGNEIAIGFTINNGAITEYEKISGKKLTYGAFAVAKEKLGTNDIFNKDSGDTTSGVVNAEIKSYQYTGFELKIGGFTDANKNVKLALGAYVIATDIKTSEYSYIQYGVIAENEKYAFTSFNEIMNA